MRIALVSDTYTPQVNGVTTVLRRIVRAVGDAGHLAAMVAPRYPGGHPPDPLELRVPSLPFPPYPSIRLSLPLTRRINRFLDSFEPDLVHVATEGPLGVLGRAWALKHDVPLMTSFHTDFPRYARDYHAGVLEPAVWKWLAWFHRPARLTHTPGDGTRAELLAHGISHAVVWGRGVDSTHFNPGRRTAACRRWLAGGDDTTIVLHVGRLAPEKNLDVLADAWRLAHAELGQRVTFALAGAGPLAGRLSSRLPFARQIGFVDRETLATLYASADLCVLPSKTETCGLVALEAMASGLPVIAANAGGLKESVRDRETGFLVSPDEPRDYVRAITELVDQPLARREYGAAARRVAVERDVRPEDAELLAQYAAVSGKPEDTASCAA
ncbi:MAG TPA: glycosyltransferase family 1 protein [Gemmatimonadales bacterium]|nr:glycosyltransferase family 1 protein [Gemmatimonadales bacterium]